MKESKAARMLKEQRLKERETQLQMSMNFNQSRENIAKQENGERKISPYTAQEFTKKYDNPWLSLQAANEYTGMGVTKLDGPAADLHRTSVQAKLMEELSEAITAMDKVRLTDNPSFAQSFEIQDIERSAREFIDVIHASTTFVATLCENYNISWNDLWQDHQRKLQSKGYVTA